MKEQSGYFTSFDGLKLFYRFWLSNQPKSVFIVHGFGEHSGRYSELIESLKDTGYSYYLLDLRGHGQSEGRRVFVETFSDFSSDLKSYREKKGLLR
jgi:acylglycerol lipase